MKNKIPALFFLTALFMLPALQGYNNCRGGSPCAFRSHTTRLSNSWKVENYKVNGIDFTSVVAAYTETYSKDGNYYYSWGAISGNGKWQFQNHNTEIRIDGTSDQSDLILFIQKLEEKEYWFFYIDGSDKIEFHMLVK